MELTVRHWLAKLTHRNGLLHLRALDSTLATLETAQTAKETLLAIKRAERAVDGLRGVLARQAEMVEIEIAEVG